METGNAGLHLDLRARLQGALGGAYILDRELGGGMSRVFLAEDVRLRRRIVVKVLSPELTAGMSAERFEREIQLAAALQHPHIVPVLSAGEIADGDQTLPFYTMPFVPGESLRARMREGRLPLAQAISVLRDAAKALAYAHKQGIVHRDIKPENVLLTDGAAVVTDFGIAKALSVSKTAAPDGTLTVVGTSLGTPAYMAPEQAAGDPRIDARADLYAWGVMAYELVAGAHPFASKHTPQQLLAAHLAEQPPELLRQLPKAEARDPAVRGLAALVMRCLEKEPPARPQSAGEILDVLDGVATPSGAVRATRPSGAGRRVALAGTGIALFVAAGVGASVLVRRRAAAPSLEAKRVVVATFENRSGDRSLDPLGAMAADWIARGLVNTGVVDVAGTSAELAARGAASAPVPGRSPMEALAADARAGIVISGAYYRQGDSVLYEASLTDANARKLVRSVGPVSAPVSRPLDGVERLRQRVTGSLAVFVDSTLAGLADVTSQPPDEPAYREFLEGEDLFYKDDEAAIAHYERAAALDSSYLYPLLRIMSVLENQTRSAAADSVGRLVAPRRDRLSPYEQAYLDNLLAGARNDVEGEYRATLAMQRAAPNSAFAKYEHAIGAAWSGRAHESDSVFATLDPASGALRGRIYFFSNWALALHALGDYHRELDVLRRGQAQYPDRRYLYAAKAGALAALGRLDALNAVLDTVAQLPADLRRSPAFVMLVALHELRFHGHADATASARNRLLAWLDAHPAAPTDTAARIEAAESLIAAEAWDRLAPLADSLSTWNPTAPKVLGILGIARAMRGDRAGAERIAAELAQHAPSVDAATLLDARAGIAAALGDLATAFTLFRQAHGPAHLDAMHVHGTWLYDRLRDYAPFRAYLTPRG